MGVYHVYNAARGMNEIIDPMLLENNQAQRLIDADVASGKIRSIKKPQKLPFDSPQQLLHFGSRNRSVVKWHERYYWSDNAAFTYGGNTEDLGVPYPAEPPLISRQRDGKLTGNFKYAVTYVNKNGWESAPGEPDSYYTAVELVSENALLSFGNLPKGIKYAKIYRTMDNGADFFLCGESEGGGFIDSMDDMTLSMQSTLDTFDDYPPPANGKYLTEAGGVFYLAAGSNLYFSKLGNPHAWSKLNFIGIDDTITGIVPEFQGILVFTLNNTYRIIGAENIETITKIAVPGNQGCVNFRTISTLANFPVWLSNDGICIWDGSNINIVSMRIMNTARLPVKYAVSANDIYYLFCADGAICYDRRLEGVFYRLSFTCDYAWYDSNTDNLYLQKDGEIFAFGTGDDAVYTYVSPAIGGNDITYKKFQEILVSADGAFNLTVSCDDKAIFSIAVKNGGRHRIKMPYSTTARTMTVKISGEKALNELSVLYN